MARKYVKTSKAIIGSVIAVLALGTVVGIIGTASKGFDQNVMDDWFQSKHDYVKINLKNQHKNKEVTSELLLETLNYALEENIFEAVDSCSDVYLNAGGLMFDYDGSISVDFVDSNTYTHIAITGHNYYEENYLDEDGEEVKDKNDELVLQSYLCDDTKVEVCGSDYVRYPTNSSNNMKTPKTETKIFKFDDAKDCLDLYTSEGRFVVETIELWNIEEVETEK